jgi:hypothetical protein
MNVFLLCVSSLKLPQSEAERAEAVVEEADGGETSDSETVMMRRTGHVVGSRAPRTVRCVAP